MSNETSLRERKPHMLPLMRSTISYHDIWHEAGYHEPIQQIVMFLLLFWEEANPALAVQHIAPHYNRSDTVEIDCGAQDSSHKHCLITHRELKADRPARTNSAKVLLWAQLKTSIWMNPSVILIVSLRHSLPTLLPSNLLLSWMQSFPSALWITARDPTKMEINQSFQEADLGPVPTGLLYSTHRWWPGSCGEHFHSVDLLQICARLQFVHNGKIILFTD